MEFEIGDEVKTNDKHNKRHNFGFEGIIDDIQGDMVAVYGRVYVGYGNYEEKHLRQLCINDIELSNNWFNEICWICGKEKLVHDDVKTSLNDPGFICEDCENDRNRSEDMLERVMFGDEDE